MKSDNSTILFFSEFLEYKNILKIENLLIEEKKITCIIGESGGGKTTLLKLLNKLISPSKGTLFFKGIDLEKSDTLQHRKEVILLSQTPYIFEGTIKDNLLIGANYHNKTISDEQIRLICEKVSLKNNIDTDASHLSGGEAQRLALARILLLNPPVILLDEPSSALDNETEDLIIKEIMNHANNNQTTIVMVTHSKQIAHKYSEKLYTIKNGTLIGEFSNEH